MKQNAHRTEALVQKDKDYVWHPFTQMKIYCEQSPLVIEKAKGSWLFDTDGRKYLDGVSSLWVNVHGHRKKEIDDAVIAQIKRVSHSTLLGLSNVPAVELAEKLVQITPAGLNRVFYSDSGSTAVEIALKMAFQYQQQKKGGNRKKTCFASLTNAYHGDTVGSVSVGGIELFHNIYQPLLFKSLKAQSPYCYRCFYKKTYPSCGLECLNSLEAILRKNHHRLAGFIIEPMVQGAAGMVVFPEGYLKAAWQMCQKYGVLFIADEVAVGFGRTGRMFACEHEQVTPDIMAVAKGITGGTLPLAATLVTDEIYSAFLGEINEFKTFYHGHTYTGNPVACAAALANIALFYKEDVLSGLTPRIAYLKKRLSDFYKLDHVGDVRQCGFMTGIELVADKKTKTPFPVEKQVAHRIILEARKQGVIIRPLGDVLILMPPLSIKKRELQLLLDVVYRSIETIVR